MGGEDEKGELQVAVPGEKPVRQRQKARRKLCERAGISQGSGLGTSVMTKPWEETRGSDVEVLRGTRCLHLW